MIFSQIFGKTKQIWFHSGGYECSLLSLGASYKNPQTSHIFWYCRTTDIHQWYDNMLLRSDLGFQGELEVCLEQHFYLKIVLFQFYSTV